ncbi:hypothetical protein CsSME_00023262 [Camellia sinensis var. sinensis]
MRIPEISYCFDAHPCKIGMLAGATIDGRVHMWLIFGLVKKIYIFTR